MDIFGIILVDPFKPSENIPNFPIFNEYLIKEINKINPTVVFIHHESGTETINQEVIDKINCPIKCYFDLVEEWMKSGLLVGNWLYTGFHFETCVHTNTLGILNMMNVKKFDQYHYGDKFNLFVRNDLLLHGSRYELDSPEGVVTEDEILHDVYCVWEKQNLETPHYFKCLRRRPVPLKAGYSPQGNEPAKYKDATYDDNIDRTNDKRLT
tara:strand:- start:119 stop:748 length:630 start_codon:yes stop_codon:yes gene_type:complete